MYAIQICTYVCRLSLLIYSVHVLLMMFMYLKLNYLKKTDKRMHYVTIRSFILYATVQELCNAGMFAYNKNVFCAVVAIYNS